VIAAPPLQTFILAYHHFHPLPQLQRQPQKISP
jgi:hypothetical protein